MRKAIEIVDHDMAAALRAKTEAERLRIAWGMWRSARDMLRNLLRAERRDWTEQQIDRELARRLSHGAC
jgi:Rv0078B-related antitoxin